MLSRMMAHATTVGNHTLPDLPSGWPVSVDTEASGLHPDGMPFQSGNQPASPEARVSVVSVTFRWPNADGTPGDIVDFAWPFDQGPVLGKPGKGVKDPITGEHHFPPITKADQDKILKGMSDVAGRVITLEEAAPNLPASEYEKLVRWLDARDELTAHNSDYDMHIFRAGMRAGAGGDPTVPEGYLAWDLDSEPGQWNPDKQQRLHMMEPTNEPLTVAKRRRQVWCTMVIQKQLVEPLKPGALKPTAKRLWGEDEGAEAEQLATELRKLGVGLTKRYDLLGWHGVMGKYAAKDTNLCFRLREYQQEVAATGAVLPRYSELHQSEMEMRTTLYRMERRGAAYSVAESRAEGVKLRAQNETEAKRFPFDPSKPASAKRFYFGPLCSSSQARVARNPMAEVFCLKGCPECGGKNGIGLDVKPENRTPTGLPQLNIDVARDLATEGQPWAQEYLDWTKRRNSDSKWYTGWAARTGRDGRIRTSYKQCKNDIERAGAAGGGTKSGRLAVGRWQSQAIPNGKLIPKGYKPVKALMHQVPAGTTVVKYDGTRYKTPVARFVAEHDLAAGEMRVVTVIAGVTSLWDALDAGADTHAMNAKALFGVEPGDENFDALRSAAKRATFGILYGGGVKAIHEQVQSASGMKFSVSQVAKAKDDFFKSYPEFKRLTDQATHKVTRWMGGPGFLTMLDGWRRWYAVDEKTNSAVNQVIQSNLARAMYKWMLRVEREIPGCLLLQVHDSIHTEHDDTPEGRAEAQRVSDIGNEEFGKYFNVRGRWMDFGIEPDLWSDKMYK